MKFAFLALALLGQFRQELPELPPQSTAPVAPKQVTPPPASKAQDAPKGAGGSQALKDKAALPKQDKAALPPPKPAPIVPIRGRFHHVKTGCDPCVPAAEFFKLYGNSLECPIEDCEYATFDEAADNGVGTVPSLELIDRQGVTVEWLPFAAYSGRDRDGKQTCGHKDKHWFCPACINRKIREAKAKAISFKGEMPAAAKPMRLPFKAQVRQAFDVLAKARIGKFSAALHSNDGKRAIRVLGSNQTAISILAVCGGSGSFVLDAPGSLIPDGRLEFGYRMSGPNRGKLMFELPFDFDSPKAAACKEACGFGPLEILSAVTMAMRLLNSSAEVALPADIAFTGAFTGTSIAAEFVKGQSPLVVINHLWTTERRFIGAEATEAGAVIRSTIPFNKVRRVEFN